MLFLKDTYHCSTAVHLNTYQVKVKGKDTFLEYDTVKKVSPEVPEVPEAQGLPVQKLPPLNSCPHQVGTEIKILISVAPTSKKLS
jgi:hypothetical protein